MKKNLNVSVGKIGLKKGGSKKMMTGGMANSNAKAVASKVATGISGGTNTPAKKQTSAGGTSSGGVNTPPTGAVPAGKYGGKMKMGGKMNYGGMKKMGKKK
jgi:hypothetical protein